MKNVTIKEISRENYEGFIKQVSHSVYHRAEWLEIIEKNYRVACVTLGFFKDGNLIAVTPLQNKKLGPFRIWGAPLRKTATPPSTPFCVPEQLASEIIDPLLSWAKRQKIKYLQLSHPSCFNEASRGICAVENLSNLEVNLERSISELQTDLSSNTRRNIRKAIRKGIQIHWKQGNVIDDQVAFLNDTYGVTRNNVRSNYPLSLYQSLFDNKNRINLKIITASSNGKALASIWVFTDREKCYYWDAASRLEARDYCANHLLVWCLIRWAHRNNYRVFDFVGGDVGGRGGTRPGIGRFKSSMGGKPVRYCIAYWYTPVLKAALQTFRFYQQRRNIIEKKIHRLETALSLSGK